MLDHVRFDYERQSRTGIPEAVFCLSKPVSVQLSLLERFASEASCAVLFTRLDPVVFAQLPSKVQRLYSYDELSQTAFTRPLKTDITGSVAIVSAGSADSAVVAEAARTLEYLSIAHETFEDCGVCGLWRLQAALEKINRHNLIIAAAGFEAALISVLAGSSPLPVIGVPVSSGYGVAAAGHTALNGILSSCAPGVCAVNIDNGFGAACLAAKILNATLCKKNAP